MIDIHSTPGAWVKAQFEAAYGPVLAGIITEERLAGVLEELRSGTSLRALSLLDSITNSTRSNKGTILERATVDALIAYGVPTGKIVRKVDLSGKRELSKTPDIVVAQKLTIEVKVSDQDRWRTAVDNAKFAATLGMQSNLLVWRNKAKNLQEKVGSVLKVVPLDDEMAVRELFERCLGVC